ncbi:DNA polymerase III subunit psi [Vibrio salinus]|uniref:DNA polymerase III subunit psi n=1 Tax=Vibrio salinus TaxID=2899784 RepID=UPI001E499348|nr:DNA polymerase III subunit psi [Vibrio salinus]MCE0493315.1 DNA polymerase III subunit psi [Vibrio salinus]
MKDNLCYLDEMGLDNWILSYPERLINYDVHKVKPDSRVDVLFICPVKPATSEEITLLEKIAGSFQVQLQNIRHVYPEKLNLVDYESLEWIWFSGCRTQKPFIGSHKILESSLLSDMNHNTQAKRYLWQQIQVNLGRDGV